MSWLHPELRPAETGFAWLLASTSGAAIIAHTFLGLPMSFTVPFVVLPTAALLVGATLLWRKRTDRLHAFSAVLMAGAMWGLAATVFYDAVRPLLRWIFRFDFNPYRAMPLFGSLMTGRGVDDTMAVLAGWTYHFWNGISFGMMFALLRPRGGAVLGLVWALLLQGLMMVVYPSFLQARLEDPGFLWSGIVGHAFWGVVLGLGLRRWGPR